MQGIFPNQQIRTVFAAFGMESQSNSGARSISTCTLEGNKKLCNLSLEIHPLLKDDDTGTTREADPREACNGESVQAFGSLHLAALSPTSTWECQ